MHDVNNMKLAYNCLLNSQALWFYLEIEAEEMSET
jgi:hypothetical protein